MKQTEPTKPGPVRAYHRQLGVASLCCVFLAMLWGGELLHLKYDRERTLLDAERENARLVRLFEEHVVRTIRAADITLRQIEGEYVRLGRKLDLARFAKEREVYLDPYTSLNIIDATGFLALSSVPPYISVDYSHNDNVLFHRENDTLGLFISTPRLGARTKLWSVFLSHRINNADGSFAGNSSLALDPFYFTKFYSDLDLGHDAVVSLVGRDGIIRARLANGNMSAGGDVSKTTVFTKYLNKAGSGSYSESSPIDGVRRLYSFRALKDYPLVVDIGASEATVLAPYYARRQVYLLLASGASFLILLFGGATVAQGISEARTLARLRDAEERFKAFMDHSPAIAFIKDTGGRYVYVNKTWEDLYAADWRGKTDADIWPRDDAEMFKESDRKALETGQTTESFETVLNKDGRPQDWWVMKFPVVDAEGKHLLGGVALDITERKHFEKSLRLTQFTVDSAVDAIFWVRPNAVIIYVNDAACRMIGYQREELIGKTVPEINPYFPAHEWAAHWQELKQKGSFTYESALRTRDGRLVNTEVSVNYIDHEGDEYNCAIIRDITERKVAEAERARLAAIVENSMDAIISRGLDLKVLTWNAAAERMFGYSAEEAIGRDLSFIVPADLRAEVEQRRQALLRGVQIASYDTVRLARDGRRIDVSLTQSPVFDAKGHLIAVSLTMRDITERKQVEEKLRYELQLFQGITDSAAESIFITDAEGRVTFANPEALATFGFSLREIFGKSLHEMIHHHHPDGRPYPKSECEQTIVRGRETIIKNREDMFFQKNGVPLNVSCSSAPILLDGAMMGTVSIVSNISDRKRAEEILRRRERQLVEAERIGRMGSWELNSETNHLEWSDEIYRIFEIDRAKFGASYEAFLNLVHPADRDAVDRTYAQSVRDRAPYEIVHRLLLAGDRVKWMHERAETFYDSAGRPVRSVGTVRDITETKNAEDALRAAHEELELRVAERTAELSRSNAMLRQKEEQLLLAQRAGHIGLWSRDLTTGLNSTSSEWKFLMGLPADQEGVSYTMFLDRIHPDDRARMEARISTLRDGEFETEFRIIHPVRGERWILSRGRRGLSLENGHRQMTGALIDITERIQAEKALRELNERLDQLVSQRTRELAESRARLRSLVAELTRAEERERRRLAVQLHDYLAQSLTAMRMDLSRADKLIANAGGNGVLCRILYDVRSDLDHSIDYTRSLIAELSPRVLYDLGLPAALAWLADEMGKHGIQVEVDGSGEGLSLTEDEAVFIYQCARELLWNVVKHAGTDRAKVAFGVDPKRFSLAVIDEGKGFDPQAKSDDGDGQGPFGLFSIKERVELRGGQVEIDSKPGAGTWATLTLPIGSNVEVAVAMEKSQAAVSAMDENIKIVIVDDHQMVRRGLRRVLEEESPFTVVGEAGDGAQAVAMAKELEPNVVIMDVNLPTMSGIEATSRIMHEQPSTIIIGLSFGSDSYLTQAMRDAGAVSCVAKERAVEEVSQAIITAVRAREDPSRAGA